MPGFHCGAGKSRCVEVCCDRFQSDYEFCSKIDWRVSGRPHDGRPVDLRKMFVRLQRLILSAHFNPAGRRTKIDDDLVFRCSPKRFRSGTPTTRNEYSLTALSSPSRAIGLVPAHRRSSRPKRLENHVSLDNFYWPRSTAKRAPGRVVR
jgi:hypothetical protein